jgi:Tfp pilus assembly protein FimT
MQTRPSRGFILIELVMTLILIGVIGAFAGLFLYKGIEGYMASKRNSEVALKAQIAVDRLSAELRHLTRIVTWTPPSFTYTCSDLPGQRTLIFDTAADEIRLRIDNGTPRVLVNDLDTYSMGWGARNLDSSADNSEELISLTLNFTLKEVGRSFRVNVFPRYFVPKPT